jgi:LysM repeat protein
MHVKPGRLVFLALPLVLLHYSPSAAEVDIVLKKGPAAEAPSAPPGRSHIVRQGETLSGILIAEGFTLAEAEKAIPEVLRLNPSLSDPNSIFPGQELRLPASIPSSSLEGISASPTNPVESLRRSGQLIPLLRNTLDSLDEDLSASGILSLPYASGGNVTIDNSVFPLLELSSGKNLILDVDGRMPAEWKERIEERWPDYDVVGLPRKETYPEFLHAILAAGGFHSVSRKEPVTFGNTTRVSILPDLLVIKTPESLLDGNLYLVNALEDAKDSLPADIRALAESHRITVVELLPVPGGSAVAGTEASSPFRSTRTLTASDLPALLPELIPLLGFTPPATQPYRYPSRQDPAITLELMPAAHLESQGKSLLIFFEPPASALIKALPRDKAEPLLFSGTDPFPVVLGTLLNAAGRSYSGPVVEFFRPDGRFTISVEGFYLLVEGRPLLLTASELPAPVASVLADSGISVLSCLIR